jgi:hypothetical protein
MSSRHYDVVILGRSLGALTTAALLARRDFRVLLLGQGQKPATYAFDRHLLRRRAFTLLAGSSPAWRRVLHELAQSPRFRRRTKPLDPMFVVMCRGRRIEIPPDMELFTREIDREFPEVRQLVDELYGTFAHVNATVDAVFEKDVVWPPGTFWERFETGRAAALLPFAGREAEQDVLAKFPSGHLYRDLATLPAVFASDLAPSSDQLPALSLARLHGAWTRGVQALSWGEDELAEFLIERILAHGGECRLDVKATSLIVRRDRIAGIMEEGETDPTGTDVVVIDQPGEVVAELSRGEAVTKRARLDWPRVSGKAGRFVVSVIVKSAALPEPLGTESFLIPSTDRRPDPRKPIVHLQRLDPLAHPDATEEAAGEALLVAETLLPARGPLTLLEAREAVLDTMREHLPFLDRHLVVVDSTHDGLPLHDYSSGSRREIDRIHLPGALSAAEPMQWQWSVEPSGYLAIAGEPVRGPVLGTYLVGKTVLPGLGQEGELLAAWSAARIVTRRDRARQKIRRQMWTKLETG